GGYEIAGVYAADAGAPCDFRVLAAQFHKTPEMFDSLSRPVDFRKTDSQQLVKFHIVDERVFLAEIGLAPVRRKVQKLMRPCQERQGGAELRLAEQGHCAHHICRILP